MKGEVTSINALEMAGKMDGWGFRNQFESSALLIAVTCHGNRRKTKSDVLMK